MRYNKYIFNLPISEFEINLKKKTFQLFINNRCVAEVDNCGWKIITNKCTISNYGNSFNISLKDMLQAMVDFELFNIEIDKYSYNDITIGADKFYKDDRVIAEFLGFYHQWVIYVDKNVEIRVEHKSDILATMARFNLFGVNYENGN